MYSDLLFIIAEIAAAFAGFASLVAAISRREGNSYEQEILDFYTLRNVLLLSLLTIAFALVPNLLERQVSTPLVAWRMSAATFVVVVGGYVVFTLGRFPRAYQGVGRTMPLSFWMNAVVLFFGLIGQFFLAAGQAPVSIYLLSLSALIYCAGFGFVRLFTSLRPRPRV